MYTLFITRGLPSVDYKMQGIFEFDQAKALVAAGQPVIYLALDLRSIRRRRKWGFRFEEVSGVPVYILNLPLAGVPKPLFLKLGSQALMWAYKKIIKENGKPQLLHAHFSDHGYMAAKLKEKIDLPLVITEHFSRVKDFSEKDFMYNVAAYAYKSCDQLVVVSEDFKKVIKNKYKVSSTYIPNVVDLDTFNYVEKAEVEKDFNFISVGRLDKLKGMDLLIIAFSKFSSKKSNVYLNIFGDGPEKVNLENLIKQYNLEAKVKLWGLRSRSEIAKMMNKSQVFVLASYGETFGLAYVEALAMGLPVIATKCGGPEGFVNKSNGLLIEVGSEKEVEQALFYMYNNLSSYNSEIISETIKSQFSNKVVSKQIIEVYNRVLSK